MAKAGDPRLKRAYRDGFRTRILQRDGYVCYYCGQDADQVDHVIPISKAPELVVNADNAVACCKRCNTSKGNRSQGLFLAKSATPLSFQTLYPREQPYGAYKAPVRVRRAKIKPNGYQT